MRYHNISKDDMLNGDGLRVVLFEAGCEHHCPGCQNPCTWDKDDGLLFDNAAKEEIFEQLNQKYISGITFSGGDPLATYNRKETAALAKEIKEKYPDKTIWAYTGYTLDQLKADPDMNDFLKIIDVIVDGRFVKELMNINYHWAGSTNQNIWRNQGNGEFVADEKKFSEISDSYMEPTCSCCS